MPRRLPSPCRYPGCRELTSAGYCARHRALLYREQDSRRPPANERGYDWNWRKLRSLVLAREPLCRECARRGKIVAATEVDHIVPLSRGGTNELDNLQPLCKSCHSRKTAKEMNKAP